MNDTLRHLPNSNGHAALPSGNGRTARPPHDGLQEAAYLGEFWNAIVRRWKLFVAVVVGFVAVVGIVTLLVPKTYTTTAQLLVGGSPNPANGNQNTSLPVLNALLLAGGDQTTETYATLLQQEGLAAQVIKDLSLNISPTALLDQVHVKPVVNTMILDLAVGWKDPKAAAQITNDFASVFVARERDLVRSQAAAALTFLKAEFPTAEKRKNEAEAALASYQSKHAIVDINTQTQNILARKGAVDSKIDAAQLDQREATALLASVNQQLGGTPATIDNSRSDAANPALMALQQQLADVNVKLAAARARYTSQHPEVIALTQQREALLRQIKQLPSSVNGGVVIGPNPVYQTLQQAAAQYRARIAGDAAQITELGAQGKGLAPIIAGLPAQT
ncbi:MAG TPA: Wzz/FepE/Etk N-terminal domain-containing protein, partial [Candidatus Dormibacteraeota bacterium]|nr:Wzz/FepE/Etk N-terminal domain-containing protein [Candidatus Dormibacteraeota bacterium]